VNASPLGRSSLYLAHSAGAARANPGRTDPAGADTATSDAPLGGGRHRAWALPGDGLALVS
jgi:hypothetical protein